MSDIFSETPIVDEPVTDVPSRDIPPSTAPARYGIEWVAARLPLLDSRLRALAPHEQASLGGLIPAGADSVTSASLAALLDTVVGTMGGARPQWQNQPRANMLPMLGVCPERGCFVVHSRGADGSWMVEEESGQSHVQSLPPGAVYGSLAPVSTRRGDNSALSLFVNALREHKSYFTQAVIASVIINLLALVTSVYSLQVYDRVIPTQGLSTLYALTAGVLVGIMLDLCAKFARSAILDHAIKGMDLDLSHRIFERLLRIRMDQFPASVGTLSAQLRSYEMIRSFASSATLYLAVDLPFAIFFLFVIYFIGGPFVAAVPVFFFVLALTVGLLHRKQIEEHAKSGMAASNRKLGLLVESVESAESIKANGSSWQFLARWNALTRLNVAEDMKVRHMGEAAGYYSGFLQQSSYVLLVAAGAYVAATSTDLTSGGLIACSILSGRVLNPVGMLPGLLVQWAHAKSALSSLEKIFALKQDNDEVEHPLVVEHIKGHIQAIDISFSYPGGEKALNLESLQIKPGQKVGILGVVGCGKSTLLKLVSGMYMPQKGRVLIDGLDVQHIARAHLSRRIGYLPQDVRLFGGSLRNNLLNGIVGVTDQDVLDACERTGLSRMISAHPKGFELPITEGGGGVSGGQKQMIALTRLLLAAPDVWLLDEPTASMDEGLEMRSLAALRNVLKEEHTLVLVTHKPALLGLVERLIILTPAGIVLDGPRDQVLAQLQKGAPAPSPGQAPGQEAQPRHVAVITELKA